MAAGAGGTAGAGEAGADAGFAPAAPPPSNALRPRPKAGFDMAGRVEKRAGVVERGFPRRTPDASA